MHVAPLSEVPITSLGALFEEEIESWQHRLYWDYRPSAELIKRFVAARSLPGFALCDGQGRLIGYSYHIASRPVGFIGDVFVTAEFVSERAYQMLLDEAFRSLQAWQGVVRIESQIFPLNFELAPLFRSLGFEAEERFFLTLDLSQGEPWPEPDPTGLPCRIVTWSDQHFEGAADVIFDAYYDSPDFRICYDYQSRQGCARFLKNLIDNPGCGTFQKESSLVAIDPEGRVCAALVTSIISPGTGMIPQVSVRRDYQGKGIGSLLMKLYFRRASEAGLARITLSVSKANRRAVDLYHRLGFSQDQAFHAFVWTA